MLSEKDPANQVGEQKNKHEHSERHGHAKCRGHDNSYQLRLMGHVIRMSDARLPKTGDLLGATLPV